MADTPTPNAILADQLEALFVDYGQANSDYGCAIERYERDRDAKACREIKAAFLEKIAALRAPTIAPTSRSSYESDCCRAAYDAGRDDAAPTITVTEERLVAALKAWDDKWRFRNDRPGARDLCMFAALEAALATPSSTIAAPSPSNNENKAASPEEVAILNEKYALKARKPSPAQADDARQVAGDDAALVKELSEVADVMRWDGVGCPDLLTWARDRILTFHRDSDDASATPRQVSREEAWRVAKLLCRALRTAGHDVPPGTLGQLLVASLETATLATPPTEEK